MMQSKYDGLLTAFHLERKEMNLTRFLNILLFQMKLKIYQIYHLFELHIKNYKNKILGNTVRWNLFMIFCMSIKCQN